MRIVLLQEHFAIYSRIFLNNENFAIDFYDKANVLSQAKNSPRTFLIERRRKTTKLANRRI